MFSCILQAKTFYFYHERFCLVAIQLRLVFELAFSSVFNGVHA